MRHSAAAVWHRVSSSRYAQILLGVLVEELPGRRSQLAVHHGNEGAYARIADVECHCRDFLPGGDSLQRVMGDGRAFPARKGHAGLLPEMSGKGSPAHP